MGCKLKPDWTGENLLSNFVNHLIQIKPIYAAMKYQARQVLIKTAEQNGIPWPQNYQSLESSGTKGVLEKITNPSVSYPDYYLVPFHAYSAGNLCWKAAFEAPSAIQSMALRVWPKENLSWQIAQDRLRHSFHHALKNMVFIGLLISLIWVVQLASNSGSTSLLHRSPRYQSGNGRFRLIILYACGYQNSGYSIRDYFLNPCPSRRYRFT